MGKVSEHPPSLIEKQLRDHGIVVWYEPNRHYGRCCETLSIPEARVIMDEVLDKLRKTVT